MSGNMKVFVAMLATCLVLGLLVSMAAAAKKKNQEPHYKNGEHNDAAHADDDKLSSADFIKKAIAEHDVVIFSKSYCPYCKRAKQLFTNENIPFHAVELDLHPNGGDIQKALQEKTGQRTVPNIFIKGEHLGGSDAAHDAHQSGRLARMLQ